MKTNLKQWTPHTTSGAPAGMSPDTKLTCILRNGVQINIKFGRIDWTIENHISDIMFYKLKPSKPDEPEQFWLPEWYK